MNSTFQVNETRKSVFIPLLFVSCLPQSQVAEKGRELKDLRDKLALVVKEKEKLEGVSDSFLFSFYKCAEKGQSVPFSLSPNLVCTEYISNG